MCSFRPQQHQQTSCKHSHTMGTQGNRKKRGRTKSTWRRTVDAKCVAISTARTQYTGWPLTVRGGEHLSLRVLGLQLIYVI